MRPHGVAPVFSAHPSHVLWPSGSATEGPSGCVGMASPRPCRHTTHTFRGPQGSSTEGPSGKRSPCTRMIRKRRTRTTRRHVSLRRRRAEENGSGGRMRNGCKRGGQKSYSGGPSDPENTVLVAVALLTGAGFRGVVVACVVHCLGVRACVLKASLSRTFKSRVSVHSGECQNHARLRRQMWVKVFTPVVHRTRRNFIIASRRPVHASLPTNRGPIPRTRRRRRRRRRATTTTTRTRARTRRHRSLRKRKTEENGSGGRMKNNSESGNEKTHSGGPSDTEKTIFVAVAFRTRTCFRGAGCRVWRMLIRS